MYSIKKQDPTFLDIAQRQGAYRDLFLGSGAGKDVLEDLLKECSVDRTALCKGDSMQTHVNIGKQLVGYHIMKLLNIQLQEIEE